MTNEREFTDVERRRLANVRTLAQRYHSNKELGDALGLTKSGISQLIGSNPIRGISERTARRWEKRLRLPEGALDAQPAHPSPAPDAPRPVTFTPMPAPNGSEVHTLDAVMREVDAAIRRHGVNVTPDKYRALITYLYRLSMRIGGQVDPADADNLVRLLN